MGRNKTEIFTTGREIKMTGQLELDLGAQSNESNKYKKVSDLDMYQQVAKTTAIYPREQAIIYPTLGLTGEAGEVANKVKKIIRDGTNKNNENLVQEISAEIGDCSVVYCCTG